MDEFASLVSYRIVLLKYTSSRLSLEPSTDAEKLFYYKLILNKFQEKARKAKDLVCGNTLVVFSKLFGPSWLVNYRPPPSSPKEPNVKKLALAVKATIDSDCKVKSFMKIVQRAASAAMRYPVPTVHLEHIVCKTANIYDKKKKKRKNGRTQKDEDNQIFAKYKQDCTNTVWFVPGQEVFCYYKKLGRIISYRKEFDENNRPIDTQKVLKQSTLYPTWRKFDDEQATDHAHTLEKLLNSTPTKTIHLKERSYNNTNENKAVSVKSFDKQFEDAATALKNAFLYGTFNDGFIYDKNFVGTVKENPCRKLVAHLQNYFPKFGKNILQPIDVPLFNNNIPSYAERYESVKAVMIPNDRCMLPSKHRNPNSDIPIKQEKRDLKKNPITLEQDGYELVERREN